MSLSKQDKKILNNAISDYQAAVREREAEERARLEAERLRHEENMKAMGQFFKTVFINVNYKAIIR